MPTQIKKVDSDGKQVTDLIRYDVYLHKTRDKRLIDYLKPFQEERLTNHIMRKLLYAAVDNRPAAMVPTISELPPAPLPTDSEPTNVQSRMKRTFG